MSDYYGYLAQVYDEMMSYVPYDNWVVSINEIVATYYPNRAPSIFEIGGGTGTLGARLSYEGYDYTGSDYSEAMCRVAWSKGIDMVCTDCRSLAIKKQYDLVVFLFDGINYLETLEEYTTTFREVAKVVSAGGLLLFDITTEYNSLQNFDDYHEAESFDDGAYIRHSYYMPQEHKQVNDFEIFARSSSNEELYSRFLEQHCQTLFSAEQIRACVPLDLFDIIGIWDGFTRNPINATSERVHFLLRRKV